MSLVGDRPTTDGRRSERVGVRKMRTVGSYRSGTCTGYASCGICCLLHHELQLVVRRQLHLLGFGDFLRAVPVPFREASYLAGARC